MNFLFKFILRMSDRSLKLGLTFLGLCLLLPVASASNCPKGQRMKWSETGRVCDAFSIPQDARLTTKGNDWVCNHGFTKTGYGENATCEMVIVPENGRLNIYGDGIDCARGFQKEGYGKNVVCRKVDLPINSHLSRDGHRFDCNRGYRKDGYGAAATCAKVEIPENAHLDALGDGIDCNRGYRRKGYRATAMCEKVDVPLNAHLNKAGNGWTCKRGFSPNRDVQSPGCEAIAVPTHGRLNLAGDGWDCNQNFIKRADSCIHVSKANDDEIRKILIHESISTYPGNCPCPYFADRAGRSCGGRSAWSRAGGYSPLCYPKDVSAAAVAEYKRRRIQTNYQTKNSD